MKLYFYILDNDREFNPETRTFGDPVFKVRVEECEVVEKPKTYRAVTRFPKGLYIEYVKKEDIGKIDILDFCSYVAINKEKMGYVLDKLSKSKIKGKYYRIYEK